MLRWGQWGLCVLLCAACSETVGRFAIDDAGRDPDAGSVGCVGAPCADASVAGDGAGSRDGTVAAPAVCGDQVCQASESCASCASDCGACPPVDAQLLATAKAWLAADPSGRAQFESTLAKVTTNIDAIMAQVQARSYTRTQTGLFQKQVFELPGLSTTYAGHVFYYNVPDHYNANDPNSKLCVMVWLHGGGSYFTDEADWLYGSIRDFEGGKRSYAMPEGKSCLVVTPQAPHHDLLPEDPNDPAETQKFREQHASRWNVPKAAPYILDLVFRELAARYRIDPDRVFITGFSMGGFGTYQQIFQGGQHFAAAMPSAGAWREADWSSLQMPIVFIHGDSDYVLVKHPKLASALLTQAKLPHQLKIYQGGHSWTEVAEQSFAAFIDQGTNGPIGYVADKRRDGYQSTVRALTPSTSYLVGANFRLTWPAPETPQTKWVTIEKGAGTIPFAQVADSDSTAATVQAKAGRATATISGNAITVQTENVSKLWLSIHPQKMAVDIAKPIMVTVDGKTRAYTCQPNLLEALQSLVRANYDWGLVYHCRFAVDLSAQ